VWACVWEGVSVFGCVCARLCGCEWVHVCVLCARVWVGVCECVCASVGGCV
jgi:hypothetical protein